MKIMLLNAFAVNNYGTIPVFHGTIKEVYCFYAWTPTPEGEVLTVQRGVAVFESGNWFKLGNCR